MEWQKAAIIGLKLRQFDLELELEHFSCRNHHYRFTIMITSIKISNFKSLYDFEVKGLNDFICLVGLNGAGKTTLLQAFDFIGHLVKGGGDFRNWGKGEFTTNGSSSRTCELSIGLRLKAMADCELTWEGKYNYDRQRFAEESIFILEPKCKRVLLSLKEGKLTEISGSIGSEQRSVKSISDYSFKGSVLGAFKFQNEIVNQVREELQSLKSLELLSPQALRKATQATDEVEVGGIGLAGYLEKLSVEDVRDLCSRLAKFYPSVSGIFVKKAMFGWRRILIREATLRNPVSATHVNDGLLRMVAILSQRYSKNSFVLFDEIENGINQEVIGKLLEELNDFNGKQIMVTTHSPLLVNYMTDEQAKASIIFLYKDDCGHTRAHNFFALPGIAERLSLMGPGEILGNTDLVKLSKDMQHEGTTL